VVDEIEKLYQATGVTGFAFFDDNFIGPGQQGKDRAAQIARLILKRKLDIVFSLECRPDDMDRELISLLKEAGLIKMSIGIESFVPRQQALYNKPLSAPVLHKSLDILNELEILFSVYLIMFDPFVTCEDLMLNLEGAERAGVHNVQNFASFLQVFPGLPLYEELKVKNMLKEHMIEKTLYNEYWISYPFRDPGMETLLAMWLRFEERMKFLFGSYLPLIEGEYIYDVHKEMRRRSFDCLRHSVKVTGGIENQKSLPAELKELEDHHGAAAENFMADSFSRKRE